MRNCAAGETHAVMRPGQFVQLAHRRHDKLRIDGVLKSGHVNNRLSADGFRAGEWSCLSSVAVTAMQIASIEANEYLRTADVDALSLNAGENFFHVTG